LNLTGSEADSPVDAERFPLVFFNLVTNAIDHHDLMGGSGIVTVEVVEGQEDIAIRVADDGPGIPSDLRDRLFEPRVSGPPENGAGLGLAIAREAAYQMGAELRFECGNDRGTTFIVAIPKDPSLAPAPPS
jgi:signal transduction histidine kinase